MSRLINRLAGRVYGWFDSKDARSASRPLPARFSRKARLMLTDLEDRSVPATFTVLNTGDNGGVNPAVGAGTGTLRQAIVDANAAATADNIVFDASFNSPSTILLSAALPTTSTTAGNTLLIEGAGANKLTVSPSVSGIKFITVGSGPLLEIRDMTITGFNNALAGGVLNFSSTLGSLTLNRVNITGNSTTSTGGALYLNSGTTNILNSTISNNSAGNTSGGGGIRAFGSGNTLNITNTTIANNVALHGGGLSISSSFIGTATLTNSSIVHNTALSLTAAAGEGAGGIGRHQATTTQTLTLNINNSIVANNFALNNRPDLAITLATGAGTTAIHATNSVIGAADGVTLATDANNVKGTVAVPLDPRVSVLGSYGGTTPSVIPSSVSPAIDLYNDVAGTDQRGLPRPAAGADAGSTERQATESAFVSWSNLAPVAVDDATTNPYVFTVNFYGVDSATLNGDEVRVTGPNGFNTLTSIVGAPAAIPGGFAATYKFTPPGGAWTGAGGVYTAKLEAGSVLDPLAAPVAPAVVGRLFAFFANNYVVTNTGDNGGFNPEPGASTGTLRQAIVDANAFPLTADTISFSGTFSTAQVINLLAALPTITDRVTMTGPGSKLLTVQRGAGITTAFNMLAFADALTVGSPMNVSGIKLIGNTTSAVTTSDEVVTLTSVEISGTSSTVLGAAISVLGGATLNLINSTLANNSSGAAGGAINAALNSTVNITGSTIRNNTATTSGGGMNVVGSATVTNNNVVTITNSTFDSNIATTIGGGLAFVTAAGRYNVSISSSTLSNNTANASTTTLGGGGLTFTGLTDAGFLIRNSTISGNKALNGGGLNFVTLTGTPAPTINIWNSTIANNTSTNALTTAGLGGGGIGVPVSAVAPTVNIESSIVAANTSANGRDSIAVIATAVVNHTFSAIDDPDGFAYSQGNNLALADSTKALLELGNLGFYGGTTKTHIIGSNSKALEAGSNPAPALDFDQTGGPRVQPVGTGLIDIGSYEQVDGLPTATMGTLPAVFADSAATNPYKFTVTYKDDVNINYLTIDGADFIVNRVGGGFSVPASVVSLTPSGINAKSIDVVYQFTPPGGNWDPADNGSYTLDLQDNEVENTGAFPIFSGPLGTVAVNVGATFTVTNTNDTGAGSLRQAITDANVNPLSPDIIDFDASFISAKVISIATALPVINGTLSIVGKGSSLLTVQRSSATAMSIFSAAFAGGVATVDISGVNVIGNTTTAVNLTGDEILNLNDVKISGVTATVAGAGLSAAANSQVFLTNSAITGNSTSLTGGGVNIAAGGKLTVTDSVISNNLAGGNGAGISLISGAGGTLNITGSTIANNSSTANGGGISVGGSTTVTIDKTTVDGNTSFLSGGGIGFTDTAAVVSFLTLTNSAVTNNYAFSPTAVGGGGGLLFAGTTGSVAIVRNTTIAGNRAQASGGGVLLARVGGDVSFQNCTITNNVSFTPFTTSGTTAVGGGGISFNFAVASTAPTLNIVSTILTGNSATNGRDDLTAATLATVNVDYSAIGDFDGFTFNGTNTNNLSQADSTPAKLQLASYGVGDFGGTTRGLFIGTGSTAIGKGSNPATVGTDQLGAPRELTGNDIGATERIAAMPVAIPGALPYVFAETPATNPYEFTVTYTDPSAIDYLTIGDSEITVNKVGSGVSIPATLISITPSGTNGSPLVAKYKFLPTGGAWDAGDNGRYTIDIAGSDVKNAANTESVPASSLGSIMVALPVNYVVTNTLNNGAGSLRGMVDLANNDPYFDIITFSNGAGGTTDFTQPQTIKLTTSTGTATATNNYINVKENLSIIGPGKGLLTLSPASATIGPDSRAIFPTNAAAMITLSLSNFTISGFSLTGNAGAIAYNGENLNLTDMLITGNASNGTTGGGAVYSSSGGGNLLTIIRSEITNNTANGGGGGGIYIDSDAVQDGTKLILIDSRVVGNRAAGTGGGGINSINQGSHVTIINSEISDNVATAGSGGGIYIQASTIGATLVMSNSTLSNNSAVAGTGGGFTWASGSTANCIATFTNCTITGNFSSGTGGGIRASGAVPIFTVVSSVVAGNTSGSSTGPDIYLATVNSFNSAIGDNGGYTKGSSTNDLPIGTPLGLQALAFNGGPIRTHAILSTSPLKHKGLNPLGFATDARGPGFPRELATGIPDIGSYEFSPVDAEAASAAFVNIDKTNAGTSNPYVFTVYYMAGTNIDTGTLGNQDVRVTGPNGYNQLAAFVGSAPAPTANLLAATYKISSPGAGGWTFADNGSYTVAVEASQVQTVDAKVVPATALGTFNVGITATFTVTNANDSGAGSLRAALALANVNPSFDEIVFDSSFSTPQTITLTGGELLVTENVNIIGPAARVTISGNKASRVFNIDGPGSLTVAISNVNIVQGTSGVAGGGLRIDNEFVTLTDVTISGNNADGNGGGVALIASPGKLSVVRALFADNFSAANGGGLDTGAFGAVVSLTDATLANNVALGSGGGLGQVGGSINLLRTTVTGNLAGNHSGGMYLGALAAVIDSSTFSGNSCTAAGGAINFVNNAVGPVIRNSTFTGNLAGTTGGAFNRASGAGVITLTSSIVAGNTSVTTTSHDINLVAAGSILADNNLVGIADTGGITLTGSGNLSGSLASPLVPLLGPLADNGGLVRTHAVLAGSPAVDAGSNPVPQTTDARGFPRENPAGKADIGAFERVKDAPSAGGGPYLTIDNANAATQDPYIFTVTFANEADIDVASLGNDDIRVTGPGGFDVLATIVPPIPGTNALNVTATYKIAAPVGGWKFSHSGAYTISAEAGKVASINTQTNPAITIGGFRVAIGTTFVVTNTNDAGAGSLRQAVLDANASIAPDTIIFDAIFAAAKTINLTSGQIFITDDVTITGPGDPKLVTVNANDISRHFNINDYTRTLDVRMSGMTLTRGASVGESGGSIRFSNEKLALTEMHLTANSTSSAGGAIAGQLAGNNLTILRSALTNNVASGDGGAIQTINVLAPGVLVIRESTISGNSAGGFGGAHRHSASSTGSITIQNSTITNNTANAATGGGGFTCSNANTIYTVTSSIISGNLAPLSPLTADFLNGTLNSTYSAIGLGTLQVNNPGIGDLGQGLPVALLQLLPLADNGGYTLTHAFTPGSPLFNAGNNPNADTFDQRGIGFLREQPTGLPDIGSFERTPGVPSAVAGPLAPVQINDGTTNPYVFTVTYSDDTALDVAGSITPDGINGIGNDIIVTGPNAFSQLAQFKSIDDPNNGTPRIVNYFITPPGGTWDFADNGNYTVSVRPNEVKSTGGVFVPAQALGVFNVGFVGNYLVTNSNDSGPGSLRQAILDTNTSNNTADTILFDTGFFNTSMKTIALATPLPAIADAVTITGPGANLASVSGQNSFRILDISPAPAKAAIAISGLTFANGSTVANGGAINMGDEALTLTNMVLTNNKANEGGAISMNAAGSTLTITGSTISNNTAFGDDGGAINVGASTTPAIVIDFSTLSGNSAASDGGGIYFVNGGSLVMTRSTVSGNTANGTGGATNLGGAGLYFFGTIAAGGFRIHNTTISGNTHNTLPGGGIGLASVTGTVEILNSTIIGNKAANGGGIARINGSGGINITSSVIAGNTTSGGPGLDISFGSAVANATFSAIGTDGQGSLNAYNAGGKFNIPLGTPLLLGALANNGGSTLTHLPLAGSPLLDTGSNPFPLVPDTDQIGNARVFGPAADIGSVEIQAPGVPSVVSFNVNNGAPQRSRITTVTVTFTGSVNPVDFTALGAVTLTRTAATPTGTVGTVVQTGATGANGLITVTQPGPANQLVLTFSNADGSNETAGVEYGSLADGRWQLAIAAAGYTSNLNDPDLRRLFGDFETGPGSNGTVDAADFAEFGVAFGSSGAPGFSPFDYDNNGTIDSGDLGAVGARFGFSV